MPVASKPGAPRPKNFIGEHNKGNTKRGFYKTLNKMQKCDHKNTEMGFGLAGGGYGAYEYCIDCSAIITKTQDHT